MPRFPFSIREIPAALTSEYIANWFTDSFLFSRNALKYAPKFINSKPHMVKD
ncbi:putative uncharacterized protein [Bacillus altitudinis]|nr:putative uncharacterized protein [Bacillus pumilus]BDC56357.1 hypothetical protein TM2_30260 [Bacillus altitudinis]BDC60069.1 hypothetical protein NC3_30290 [Bacillus altitudinis]GJI57681.1 hypothetical protein BATMR_07090 [Bacillus altitudinis]